MSLSEEECVYKLHKMMMMMMMRMMMMMKMKMKMKMKIMMMMMMMMMMMIMMIMMVMVKVTKTLMLYDDVKQGRKCNTHFLLPWSFHMTLIRLQSQGI